MTTLILVTSDAAAGHLARERRADRILTFIHRLVTGPVPTDGTPETFFKRQRALFEAEGLFHEPWWFEAENLPGDKPLFKRVWSRLPDVCLEHDQIELWIDPDPNAQLTLLQLLDWLGQRPEIARRLWLKQAESPLGERRLGDWTLPPRPIGRADIALASRAWAAFGAPTPEAWSALRHDPEPGRLPGLERTIERMLDELPDRTGLGVTARRILGMVERQPWWTEAARRGEDVSNLHLLEEERRFSPLIKRVLHWGERLPLWHFEVGQTLCDLAAGSAPAVTGVTERFFDLDMHQDEDRFRRFNESLLVLTEFGCRLVAGEDDWSRHNPIHRWWGGTRLTNETLWRWDAAQGQLLAPA